MVLAELNIFGFGSAAPVNQTWRKVAYESSRVADITSSAPGEQAKEYRNRPVYAKGTHLVLHPGLRPRFDNAWHRRAGPVQTHSFRFSRKGHPADFGRLLDNIKEVNGEDFASTPPLQIMQLEP